MGRRPHPPPLGGLEPEAGTYPVRMPCEYCGRRPHKGRDCCPGCGHAVPAARLLVIERQLSPGDVEQLRRRWEEGYTAYAAVKAQAQNDYWPAPTTPGYQE